MNVRCAIVGPTGYTGLFLLEWLSRHPSATVTYLASHREALPHIVDEFPQLQGVVAEDVAVCRPIDPARIAREADVAFLGLPHLAAAEYAGALLDAGVRVIDLSADYRLADPALYEAVYGQPHPDVSHLSEAVYGLTEFHRSDVASARLVANPGCYPTAAALAICPLVQAGLVDPSSIIINAASGVTGAGRSPKPNLHYVAQNEAYQAYGAIGGHRHQPEIEQTVRRRTGVPDAQVLFVPHLLPIDQGILETIYLTPSGSDVTQADLDRAFAEAYADEPFIRLRREPVNVKHVRDRNVCDLHVRMTEPIHSGGARRIVVFSAIDNMVKGASGQAIQNMNVMFSLDETAGLR